MRALLVEDDAAARSLVERLLSREGYDVDAVGDASGARARVKTTPYDLAILDFVLPDSDGLLLLREWRREGRDFPVLALTGAESDAITEGFLRAGAHDVIEKRRLTAATLRTALDGLSRPTHFKPPVEIARASPDDDGDAAPTRPGRALVVDDVVAARRVATVLLEREGWIVDEATTAAEGLRAAFAHDHDVILLDQLLPDAEGIGLFQELRRRGIRAPVIALTAHADEHIATEFMEAGAVDLISKERLSAPRLREALARAADARAGDPGR